MMIANIPKEMKEHDQWVLWKLEKDNKKVPYAITGRKASTTDRSTWSGFTTTVEALKENKGYSGMGFVFSKDDPLCFIDLDHCISDDGEFSALAENILGAFVDTYTEISQSGTGIHIICNASIPKSVKSKEVEIYNHSRYCAITGDSIGVSDIADKQDDVEILFAWVMRNRQENTSTSVITPRPLLLTEKEVIDKALASKGGDRFRELYAGRWQKFGIGDGSQSSADISFANTLAFYTGCNKSMMQNIFRSSGMYRSERKMNLAIDYALNSCDQVYRG